MWFRKRGDDRESKKALEEAHENLRRNRARTDEVHEVSNALRSMRERNHFREQLQAIMEGGN